MKKLLIYLSSVLFFIACNNKHEENENGNTVVLSKEEYQKNINALEQKLFQEKTGFDRSTANAVVTLYANYARTYPDDPASPEYLFKAGEISSSLNQSEKAIAYFDTLYTKYPKFDKAPYSLFLQAFIYENQLKNLDKARKLYNLTIHKFPNHQVALDSKASLQNLGKSEEELIREFEKKNIGK